MLRSQRFTLVPALLEPVLLDPPGAVALAQGDRALVLVLAVLAFERPPGLVALGAPAGDLDRRQRHARQRVEQAIAHTLEIVVGRDLLGDLAGAGPLRRLDVPLLERGAAGEERLARIAAARG